jgi:hypothetical protein
MINGDPGYQDRAEAFGYGVNGGPVAGSPSLDQDQQSMNSSTPAAFHPSSVLHQMSPSMIGTAADQVQRTRLVDGSTLPTGNGSSDSTYQASFRMMKAKPPVV